MTRVLAALLAVALGASACSDEPQSLAGTDAAPAVATAAALDPQVTPEPTATAPTATPEPTPAPTATPEPTPAPTATPTPAPAPTATPEPTPEPTATPTPAPATLVDWRSIVDNLLFLNRELEQNPTLDILDALCQRPSTCYDQRLRTYEALAGNGNRLQGGTPWELIGVDYQGTADGVEFDQSLAVTVIVYQRVTAQAPIALVNESGEILQEVSPDLSYSPGQQTSRVMTLGRTTLASPWKILDLGTLS